MPYNLRQRFLRDELVETQYDDDNIGGENGETESCDGSDYEHEGDTDSTDAEEEDELEEELLNDGIDLDLNDTQLVLLEKKRRCGFCSEKKDRKTSLACAVCHVAMCDDHRSPLCRKCKFDE